MMKAKFIFMTIAASISYRLHALQDLAELHETQQPDPLYYQRHTGVYR
jgi:hypothetical protein